MFLWLFFPSLKQNFLAYHSSKVSSDPDCIFEIPQLWQSGFSRVYSNCCCSCSFEPEIIKIGQSSYKMYSNNIVNFQESMTILDFTKKPGNLLNAPRILESFLVDNSFEGWSYVEWSISCRRRLATRPWDSIGTYTHHHQPTEKHPSKSSGEYLVTEFVTRKVIFSGMHGFHFLSEASWETATFFLLFKNFFSIKPTHFLLNHLSLNISAWTSNYEKSNLFFTLSS